MVSVTCLLSFTGFMDNSNSNDDDNIDNMMIMLIMTILTELRKRGRTQRQVYARQNPRYSALLRAVARKKPEVFISIMK